MSIEVKGLLFVPFFFWLLAQLGSVGKTMTAGIGWNMGNRMTEPEFPGWVKRTERAHRNLGENLPLFMALVLLGIHTQADMARGVSFFVVARVVHAALLILGIPFWRTVAYGVSIFGLVQMFLALVCPG